MLWSLLVLKSQDDGLLVGREEAEVEAGRGDRSLNAVIVDCVGIEWLWLLSTKAGRLRRFLVSTH